MPKPNELIGKTFGYLTVVSGAPRNSQPGLRWLVACSCPSPTCLKFIEVQGSNLTRKIRPTSSCGARTENLLGQKFNKLTVTKFLGVGERSFGRWLCQCDCGGTTEAASTDLKYGNVGSCGCATRVDKAGWRSLQTQYKAAAKKRNLCWELSFEDVVRIAGRSCSYCGEPPRKRDSTLNARLKEGSPNARNRRDYVIFANGLDRVDNNRGYTLDNVVACCRTCNWMKADRSKEEFLSIVSKIHARATD